MEWTLAKMEVMSHAVMRRLSLRRVEYVYDTHAAVIQAIGSALGGKKQKAELSDYTDTLVYSAEK